MTKLPLSLAVAAGLNLTAAPLYAEEWVDEDGNINDRITVEGQYAGIERANVMKTPTPLLDVPQSLSVISELQIDEQAFMDMADILRYTPGASIGQGEGHRDQMTIRGQNTTADFFIDGVRDDVQYFRPLYNVERVEILRGSNALLYGRGGGGGIINRVMKTAQTGVNFTELTASLDTFGAGFATFDTNVAIGDDQAFRLNGYYESIENHRDVYDGDRFAFNPTFTQQIGSDTRLTLSYEYVDDDRVVDRGVPALNGRPLTGFEDTFFGDPDINLTTFEGHIAKARVEHKLNSAWSIDSSLQYADYDKLYQNLYPAGYNGTTNVVKLDGYKDTTQRENLIFQFNLLGQFKAAGFEHTLLTGVEYGDQQTENDRRDTLFADSQDDQIEFLFTDPLNIPAYQFTDFVRDRESDVTFSSFFIQDEIALNENWIVVLGARYDRFEIDVVDQIQINNGAADGNNGFLGNTDNEVSPRVGVIYKPMANLSFYASVSESFLPRSGDQFLTLSLNSAALEAETFENREVGMKWDVTSGLSLTAAVFEIERENGTAVDPNDPERSLLTGTETRGFELQLMGEVMDGWYINAGYSYLDANQLGNIEDGELRNRTLSQVPENMLSVWNRFVIDEKWGAGLGITYQDEQYTSLSNRVKLPKFTRVDAAVFYTLNDQTKIQLNIENLFDKEYFPAAHNDNNLTTGEPINARLSVNYQF